MIFSFFFVFPDKLDLVSQELVKLAKDNGSSDNISIVVVFLKPIEELAAMELPIDTKDLDTISQNGTNNMMNNNEKEALYDGITSTSIYVGKNSIEVRLFLRSYQSLVKLTFLISWNKQRMENTPYPGASRRISARQGPTFYPNFF